MVIEASAATTYVKAAHLRASFAFSCSRGKVRCEASSHFNALAEASNSTGNVMTENKVDMAKRIIPINNREGLPPPKLKSPRPIKIIHCEKFVLT